MKKYNSINNNPTKNIIRSNFEWFFRSFAISFTIVFAVLTVIFGCSYCEAVAKHERNGKEVSMLEKKDDGIYFYGRRIF